MGDGTRRDAAIPTDFLPQGLRLATADAMRGRETFTKAQVAVLIALAFESGTRWAHNADVAEVWVGFRDHPLDRKSADERRRDRLAWMEDAYNRQQNRLAAHRATHTDPDSWPTVAHVGPLGPS